MQLHWAILLSVVIFVGCFTVSSVLGFNPAVLVILMSAVWAYYDAQAIRLEDYDSGISMEPGKLFVAMILGWPVCFPWYLFAKYNIQNGLLKKS